MARQVRRISDLPEATELTGDELLEIVQGGDNKRVTADQLSGGEAPVQSVQGRTGDVVITADDVGLGNVDNTSDADKPVSTAQQAALDGKVDKVAGMGLSTNDFTDPLRDKLIGLEGTHWRGTFVSLAALQAGVTDPEAGDYADVDVVGADVVRYIWDSTDDIWVAQSGAVAPIDTDDIVDGAVTPEKTSFIKTSRNLLNPAEVSDYKVVNVSGELVDSANYRTSGFIAVEPGSLYSWYGSSDTNTPFTFVSEYDEDRGFNVRRSAVSTSGLTARPDTRWVRLSYSQHLDMDRMFVQGGPPASYEPYTKVLEGVTLSPTEIKEIKVGQDRPMLDITGDLFFGTDDDFADIAGFNTLSTSDVHSLWDSLMADNPEYITKTTLGDDAFGNSIALYRLSPPRPVTPFNNLRRPKIFLISGIHGGEDVSGFGTYVLANSLCNAWASDAALEMLRFNVELLVIPVANPSGWNARTRKNGNGVDLNRNFPDGWVESDPADITYGGPSPLSELEAQYISQVMQENPDIDMFCDFHNFGAGGGTGGSGNSFVWVSSVPGRYVPHLAQIMMQRLTRKWRTDYDWIPDDPAWFAGYASVSTGGMAKIHALEAHGIDLSATFEVCNVWNLQPGTPLYSPEQKRSTIEALVNWLVLNVKEVVRRG